MHGIHTHYDNLRVSRGAHPKIIREAYKKLSRQYHPDHNPNNPEATRAMQVINLAYDVLSDPAKRKEHDEWIARLEAEQQEPPASPHGEQFNYPAGREFRFGQRGAFPFEHAYAGHSSSEQQKKKFASSLDKKAIGEHIFKHWFWYVLTIAIIIGFGYHSYSRRAYSPFMSSHEQYRLHAKNGNGLSGQRSGNTDISKEADKPAASIPNEIEYARPSTTSNGQPWPAAAAYLSGYEQTHMNGLSSVSIENDRNGSAVMVKLFDLKSGKAVRVIYMPAQESFKVEKLPPGLYDIRFMDLKSGMRYRTEPFELHESNFANGFRHTVVSMSLNGASNGQSSLQNLKQEDF